MMVYIDSGLKTLSKYLDAAIYTQIDNEGGIF